MGLYTLFERVAPIAETQRWLQRHAANLINNLFHPTHVDNGVKIDRDVQHLLHSGDRRLRFTISVRGVNLRDTIAGVTRNIYCGISWNTGNRGLISFGFNRLR